MADEEIRIIVEAIDLASAKLRDIGKNLDDTSGRTDELSKKFRQLDATNAAISRSTGNLASDFRQLDREAQNLAKSNDSLGQSHRKLSGDVQGAIRDFEDMKRSIGGLNSVYGKFERDLQGSIRSYEQMRSRVQGATRDFEHFRRNADLAGNAIDSTGKKALQLTRTSENFDDVMRDLSHGMERLIEDTGHAATSFEQWGKELEKTRQSASGNNEEFLTFGKSIEQVGLSLAKTVPSLAAGASGLYLIGNAVGAASAGVIGLASALSSLIGLADVAPAALTGLAGSIAAIQTVFQPAASGIEAAIKAQAAGTNPATAPLGTGGSSGGSNVANAKRQGAQQVGDAERALARARQQNIWQIADLENRLRELRIHNAQQVGDAERALAQAQLSGIQQIEAAERRLHDLRMQDRAQEQQLQLALANAQASAAGEAARGGSNQEIANAAVTQAQDNLTQFQQQASSNEATAQDQVTQAVQSRNQQVADAERALSRTRQDNANQLLDLENQISQARIQNAQQVADAERSLARARIQAAQSVAAAEQSAQGGTNSQLDRYKQILGSLTPIQRQIVQGIIDIKKQWAELTAPARENFLKLALDVVHQLQDHLPALATLVSHYANVIVGIGRGVLNNITQPQNFKRDTGFANQQASNLGTLGKAGVNVLQTVETIATSKGSEQFLHWLAQATFNVTQFFSALAKGRDAKDGFVGFFDATRRTLTQVAKIIWNLADAFTNIFEVGFKPGSGFLGGIENLTKRFDNWTKSQKGKDSLREFIQNGMKDLHEWARVLGPVIKLIGEIVVLTTNWTGPLQIVVNALSWILNNPLGRAVFGPLFSIAAAFAAIGYVLPGNQKTLTRIFGLFKDLALTAGRLLLPILGEMTGAFIGLFTEGEVAAAAITADATAMDVLAASAGAAEVVMAPFLGVMILIVAAVVAVIAIFVLLYLKWKPFHEFVDFMAHLIEHVLIAAFKDLWDTLDTTIHIFAKVIGFIIDHWKAFLIIFFPLVGSLIVFLANHWDTVKKDVQAVWNWMYDFVTGTWNKIIDYFQGNSKLAQAFRWIGTHIEQIWHGIWTSIYNSARDVWDKFADGVNFVLKLLGSGKGDMLPHLPNLDVSPPKNIGPVSSSSASGGGHHAAAMGGRFQDIPGGMIHIVEAGAPEYVISTDPKYKARSLGLIADLLAELGIGIPKFAMGGAVAASTPKFAPINWAPGISESGLQPALSYLAGWISSHGGIITSGTGGTHATNSYHYKGEAIDIGAPGYNSPWIWEQLFARKGSFAELLGPTFMPGGGGLWDNGIRFYDPVLQAQHQNHIHSAFTGSLAQIVSLMGNPGAGGGLGLGGLLSSVINAVSPAQALHWVEDHVPGFDKLKSVGGKMGEIMFDIGDSVRQKFFDWVKKTPGMIAKIIEHIGGSLLSGVGNFFSTGSSVTDFGNISQIHGNSPQSNIARGQIMAKQMGWTGSAFQDLVNLWNRESGWRWNAKNASSGAYGIPQALPASKMASAGADWMTNPATQIAWGLNYIKSRYGDPVSAWHHELSAGWYDFGGQVDSPVGTPTPAIVHGGEWIINRMQQMRLAKLFGSWQGAKQYLFTSQGPSYGSLYPHSTPGAGVHGGPGGVQQTFILHEIQPQTDMDYVMRMAEIHARRLA